MKTPCDYGSREGGPFDHCLECEFLGNGCSGPRTTAMTSDRYLIWMTDLKKLRGVGNQTISDSTGLSKATVDDFFAGRRKDIGRITAGLMEDYLIGGDAKWPCAMELAADNKEIVYQDRPETLEALRIAQEVMADKDERMAREREAYLADVQEYKDLVAHMRAQIDRKDDYIDRLARKAGI